jgi:hypothetical protein
MRQNIMTSCSLPKRSSQKQSQVSLFASVLIHNEVFSAFPYFRNIAAYDSSPAIRTYHLLSVVISGSERLRSDIKFEESFLKLSLILYLLSFFLRLISSLKICTAATSTAEGGNSKKMKPGIKIDPKMKRMQL